MANHNSSDGLPMAVQIDLEMFQWSAAMGIQHRLDSKTILTKSEFMEHESVQHIGHSLKVDMYRAYHVGYEKAPVAIEQVSNEV